MLMYRPKVMTTGGGAVGAKRMKRVTGSSHYEIEKRQSISCSYLVQKQKRLVVSDFWDARFRNKRDQISNPFISNISLLSHTRPWSDIDAVN